MTTNGLRGGASSEATNGHSNGTYSNGSSGLVAKSAKAKSSASAPPAWYLDSGFWRRFIAVAVVLPVTALNLISISVSNDESRQLLKVIDPKLGVKLTEVNYALDCSQIWDKIMDPFMPCHFIGWLIATVSLRDWKIVCCFFMIDEMLEVWWAPVYPNFAECWWDAIILDILVCNLLGALAGQALLRWLGWEEHDFFKGVTKSPYRLAFILHIVGSRIIGFMALFGWKNVMWVPSSHWTNIVRMLCYVFAGDVAFEEAYHWLEGKNTQRKGRDFWMLFYWVFVFIEFAHTYKMGYCDPIWEQSSDWQRVMAVVLIVLQLFSFLVLPVFQPLLHHSSPAPKAVKTL